MGSQDDLACNKPETKPLHRWQVGPPEIGRCLEPVAALDPSLAMLAPDLVAHRLTPSCPKLLRVSRCAMHWLRVSAQFLGCQLRALANAGGRPACECLDAVPKTAPATLALSAERMAPRAVDR